MNNEIMLLCRFIYPGNFEHGYTEMDLKILAVGPRWFERCVREAIHIRMEQPSLN